MAALRAVGCSVWFDLPVDLLVVTPGGGLYAIEVKDGTLPPSRRKLTDREREFLNEAGDRAGVALSPADALELVLVSRTSD